MDQVSVPRKSWASPFYPTAKIGGLDGHQHPLSVVLSGIMPIGPGKCLGGQCRQIQVLASSQPDSPSSRPAHPPNPPPAAVAWPRCGKAPGAARQTEPPPCTLCLCAPPVPRSYSILERLKSHVQARAFCKCHASPKRRRSSHSQSGSRQRFVRVDRHSSISRLTFASPPGSRTCLLSA